MIIIPKVCDPAYQQDARKTPEMQLPKTVLTAGATNYPVT